MAQPSHRDASNNLSQAQKARIERNKQRALHLKQSKLTTHPYSKSKSVEDAIIKVAGKKYVDSGGGFLIEDEIIPDSNKKPETVKIVEEKSITIPVTYTECIECTDKFFDSYLHDNFGHAVCDNCRDPNDKHCLITRTEAKSQYLLKNCDLDRREPILKFLQRRNPRNSHWGEMKLYLRLQIEKRALEVWGSEEELDVQRETREDKRTMGKIKKFRKQMKMLRMDVRSSLYDRTKAASHTHEFGPDISLGGDQYEHKCLTCNYTEKFEKM